MFPSAGYYYDDGTLNTDGGDYFGSLYYPKYCGCHGGNGHVRTGGRGGGYVGLEISTHLLVDGTISVDASHATTDGSGNTDAGGGSGGTIFIRYIINTGLFVT